MTKSQQTSAPVTLTVEIDGGTPEVIPCDLLVVACDPRRLEDVCEFTENETAVFDSLINYTFHTTVVKVPVPTDPASMPAYGIILKPEAIDNMAGNVSGYRNETAKQFSLQTANSMAENLVTVYQIQKPCKTPWTNEQFLQNLRDTLSCLDWWPYASFEICTDPTSGQVAALSTPYFDHFNNDNLVAKMPWNYLDVQGTGNTIYVHGSTCFESVLQCWQFGDMLLKNQSSLGYELPSSMDATIIILGAGPSGMLFAHRLQCLGYTNVQILESTDRFGGKTHTVTFQEPSPPGPTQDTPCELGTCYMSPAYDDMADDLKDFMKGNARRGFFINKDHNAPTGSNFRGMVTEDQFSGVPMKSTTIGYSDYVSLRGFYEAHKPFSDPDNWLADYSAKEVGAEIGIALVAYWLYVDEFFGTSLPMPTTPPQALLDEGYTSFHDMLKKQNLLILTGLLEYSYSVQGYGPLNNIPAYYGMIWISKPLVDAILKGIGDSVLHIPSKPTVTVLSKGWLDIWVQMEKTLTITLKAKVTNIERILTIPN